VLTVKTWLGVAGWPVAHSRSPAMQNAALAASGLKDWRYLRLPLAPDVFAETVRALPARGFRGVNVTIPHKEAALALADVVSAEAGAIGAANTLTFAEGRILAENTDAGGFLDALGRDPRGLRVLVLGAGGSARAVVWALREAGAGEVSVWNRTTERAKGLAREFGVRHAERPEPVDLLVNCTSVGLDRSTTREEALEGLGLAGSEPPPTVADLVYSTGATPLIEWAERAGARVVNGMEVLVCQGARSLAGWTGRASPLDTMRSAVQQ